jgi:hypothetical protein
MYYRGMANTPITPVRIPLEIRERLEAIAKAENRNVSNVVVTLLLEALATRDRRDSRKKQVAPGS